MKKLFVFILFSPLFLFSQYNYPTVVSDTVVFQRFFNVTQYTAGDVVADSLHTYFTFSNIGGGRNGSRGKITSVTVIADTANATTAAVKVRFFSVSDTTNIQNAIAVDNGVYQSMFQLGNGKYLQIGDVAITLAMYGTSGGGATAAEGSATAALPYTLLNSKLYAVVIATAAYTPKKGGKIRIIVTVDRQF
jgi:hypothetical protein